MSVAEGEPDSERDGVPLCVSEGEPLCDRELVCVCVWLGVAEPLWLRVADCELVPDDV